MPRPVRQEDLDFASCENDRYESEIVKWKNQQKLEALEQDAIEVQKILSNIKKAAVKKFEEAEKKRAEELQKWRQLYERIEMDYEKERIQRQREFESQQAKWKQMTEDYELMVKKKVEAEQERVRKDEEAKKQDAINKQKALEPQKITPFLLCTCIHITGAELVRVYQSDALRLLSVVHKAYVLQPPPEVRALLTTSPSAMSRLKTMLEEAIKNG
ncbi:16691_t:CDS:2, partial [Acaulospora colombiana]